MADEYKETPNKEIRERCAVLKSIGDIAGGLTELIALPAYYSLFDIEFDRVRNLRDDAKEIYHAECDKYEL
jgi:hypothetical protein